MMYEENSGPLPAGDALAIFAEQFGEIANYVPHDIDPGVTLANVRQSACPAAQPYVAKICRRLLLPGSCLHGHEHLTELGALARSGNSCLLCLFHRSNLDVPTLYTLLLDQGDSAVFHQIIWVAGRKLSEDCRWTSMVVRCFHSLTLTPHSWFATPHGDKEVREARMLNFAALRALLRLRHKGWIFGLFPAGTRLRPGRESTAQAIEETDTYVKAFDYMVLGHIHGCTLPVSKNHDLVHEIPQLDRMIYSFGPVLRTKEWRARVVERFPQLRQREASARAMMADIEALGPVQAPYLRSFTPPFMH
jgi:hypothetical protein